VVGPSTWNIVSAVLVTLEAGWGEADPMPVLTLAGKDTANHVVRQTWREATALAASLRPTHYCVSVPAAPLRRPARRSSSSTTPPTTRCGCTRPSAPTSSGCGRWYAPRRSRSAWSPDPYAPRRPVPLAGAGRRSTVEPIRHCSASCCHGSEPGLACEGEGRRGITNRHLSGRRGNERQRRRARTAMRHVTARRDFARLLAGGSF
jgi:hypothetical protein